MIQNVLMTNITPLCNTNEIHGWENRPFSSIWPEDQTKKSKVTKTIKKKSKRARTAFSTDQLRALERTYSKNKYIDTERRRELANSLNIGEKCVKVWFQNRRMKEKKESSESSSESANDSEMSPPLPEPEPTNNPNHYIYYDPYYQLPYFYPYNGNANCASTNEIPPTLTGSTSGVAFYNDGNVYPTQYYPSIAQNTSDFQYIDTQNYWSSDNNLCYF